MSVLPIGIEVFEICLNSPIKYSQDEGKYMRDFASPIRAKQKKKTDEQ
jgi:hypothetical protein